MIARFHFRKKEKEEALISTRKTGPRKKGILAVSLFFLLLAAGFIIVKALRASKEKTTAVVKSAKVQKGDVKTTISSSGTLEGVESTPIYLPEGILIKKILVSEGDIIQKGTKIAEVDKASVAEVLLTVRDSIDTLEDDIDELDDDELTDTTSDDYLKKIAYDKELADLNDLEDSLETMLNTGYLKSDEAGLVGAINITESEKTEDSSDSTSTTGSSQQTVSQTTQATQTTYYGTVAQVVRMSSNDLTTSTTVVSDKSSKKSTTNASSDEDNGNTGSSNDTTTKSDDSNKSDDSSGNNANQSDDKNSNDSDSGNSSESDDKNSDDNSSNDTGKSDDNSAGQNNVSDNNTTDKNNQKDSSASDSNQNSSDSNSNQNNTNSSNTSNNTDSNSTTTTNNTNSTSSKSTNNTNNTTTNGSQSKPSGGNSKGGGSASGSSSGSSTTSADTTESIGDITLVKAVELHSDTQMLVNVSVDEADISSVKTGQTATVSLTALADKTFEGSISDVGSVNSDSSGSVKYSVDILLDKEDGMLEGMSASVVINVEESKDTLTIPSAAVQEKGASAFVYTAKDEKGNLSGEKEVRIGLSDGTNAEVTEGLEEGDTVYYSMAASDPNSETGNDNQQNAFGGGPGQMPDGGTPPSGGPGGNGGGAPGGNSH